jgi:hypothetical protein
LRICPTTLTILPPNHRRPTWIRIMSLRSNDPLNLNVRTNSSTFVSKRLIVCHSFEPLWFSRSREFHPRILSPSARRNSTLRLLRRRATGNEVWAVSKRSCVRNGAETAGCHRTRGEWTVPREGGGWRSSGHGLRHFHLSRSLRGAGRWLWSRGGESASVIWIALNLCARGRRASWPMNSGFGCI